MKPDTSGAHVASIVGRVLTAFVLYALLLAATASLSSVPGRFAPSDDALQAVPLAALASSGVLSFLILRARRSGIRLALAIAGVSFGAQTLLPLLRGLTLRDLTEPSRARSLALSVVIGALFAAVWATAAVALLRRHTPAASSSRSSLPGRAGASLAEQLGKLGGGVALYALSQLAVTAAAPPSPPNALLAGCAFTLTGLALTRLERGTTLEAALVSGAFFAAMSSTCFDPTYLYGACLWAPAPPLLHLVASFTSGAALAYLLRWTPRRPSVAELADRVI